jgi:hypothetical protein
MKESASELLASADCFADLMAGIDLGGRLLLSIPDALYAKTRRLQNL